MKKQRTIKAKKLRNHAPNAAKAYWCYKYDRPYVRNHTQDVTVLPMSRSSRRIMWMLPYEHSNRHLWRYLNRFMEEQVGRKHADVFRDFKRLGWKSTYEMYYYWDWYVSNNPVTRFRYDYYESEDGIFTRVA